MKKLFIFFLVLPFLVVSQTISVGSNGVSGGSGSVSLNDSTVVSSKLAKDAVKGLNVVDFSLSGSDIQNNSLGIEKLQGNGINGQVPITNGLGLVSWGDVPSGSLSTENQNRIVNTRTFKHIYTSGNVNFTAENFSSSSTSDLKKTVFNYGSPGDTIFIPPLPVFESAFLEAPGSATAYVRSNGSRFKIQGETSYAYEFSYSNWDIITLIPEPDGITYKVSGKLIIGPYSPSDVTPPSVPVGLVSTSQTGGSITLDWSDSSDNVAVTGYRVYRDAVQVGTSVTSNYVDNGLTSSTSYTYTVASYDASGNQSSQSSPLNQSTTNGASDPFIAQSFDEYYSRNGFITPSGLDGQSITEWHDAISGNVFASSGGTDPELDITNGFECALFNGSDTWFGQGFGFTYNPAVDNMTIALQIGSQAIVQGAFYSRTSSSNGNGFYFLDPSSASNSLEAKVGSSSVAANPTVSPGDLIIFECTPTGIDIYHNNVLIVDDGPIGTTTSTLNNNIGARTDGSFVLNGSLAIVARKMAVLTAQERLDLYNFSLANQ